MKYVLPVFLIFLLGLALTVFSHGIGPHQFAEGKCRLCHEAPARPDQTIGTVMPVASGICIDCHRESSEKLSHPVDVIPGRALPEDMPLVAGKLGCISCHVVHPFTLKHRRYNHYLLRRPGRGAIFCSACHGIDERGHIVFEKVHQGAYRIFDPSSTLDVYSLQCIECHDRQLNKVSGTLGAGQWQHFSSTQLDHPVGISYERTVAAYPRKFNPSATLPEAIRLFDGKLGCGTCHNAYSKEKNMLVTSNWRSGLCLSCHIK